MSEKTILVVDDERHIVDLVKLYLEAEGFRVEAAYDGNAALRSEFLAACGLHR